jgi:solute carrier family 10 (sodium/bile acid cotransporter), member 7
MKRPRFLPDNFTLGLIATVALASVLPCRGAAIPLFDGATDLAVALLFFLHGAKLSREAVIAGATHWRLHLVVFCSTFVLFPLIGVALRPLLAPLVSPALYMGILYLCVLPSTVQSSIAFTSAARGNVAAAVCSASASSLLSIAITPALVSLLITAHGATSASSAWHTVASIVMQLLVPFVAGQLLRPLIGGWIDRNRGVLKFVDNGSILLIVYVAFSEAVDLGLWHQVGAGELLMLLLICAGLLALVLSLTTFASKRLGFNTADRITIIFCGSKKSLATGVPMAKVIFSAHAVGLVVLPLMLFHQLQLMVCAVLAQRWGARPENVDEALHAAID